MKARRHAAILRLIREHPIETQEELVARLSAEGIEATQATISRDIKELRLVKVPAAGGRSVYALPPRRSTTDLERRARRAFADYLVDVEASGQLVALRCLPGSAHTVAAALDELGWEEVLATVAGDDTVLVVVREEAPGGGPVPPPPAVASLLERIERFRSEV